MPETHKITSITSIGVLKDFQRHFSRLTGLHLSYVNLDADFITDDRGNREFCMILADHENASGASRCWDSNYAACRKVFKKKKPLIYRCHAGLTEIIVPIFSNGNVVGAVMAGQIRSEGAVFPAKRFTGLDTAARKRLENAFYRVPALTDEQVQSCAGLLSLMTSYIFKAEHILTFSGMHRHSTYIQEILNKALAYIRDHYRDPGLSLNRVAEEVHLSPFYFSHIFKKTFHTTFVDYLTRARLDETIRLLKDHPEKSIKEIAFHSGYEDPYYFSRVFRKAYKLSPLSYRQRFL